MQYRNGASALVVISAIAISGTALGQAMSPTNSLPNPYRSIENWAQLPQGRIWGSTSAIGIDPDEDPSAEDHPAVDDHGVDVPARQAEHQLADRVVERQQGE